MYYLMPLSAFSDAEAEETLEENAAIPADDIVFEDAAPEEAEPTQAIVRGEVTAARWMLPASMATQIFSVVPGVAGGLAGFILATKISKAKSVKATEVLMAAGAVALITFMSVFLVRTIDEFE